MVLVWSNAHRNSLCLFRLNEDAPFDRRRFLAFFRVLAIASFTSMVNWMWYGPLMHEFMIPLENTGWNSRHLPKKHPDMPPMISAMYDRPCKSFSYACWPTLFCQYPNILGSLLQCLSSPRKVKRPNIPKQVSAPKMDQMDQRCLICSEKKIYRPANKLYLSPIRWQIKIELQQLQCYKHYHYY